jgi:hypothetical protein
MKDIDDEIKIKSNNQLMVFRLGNELEYELAKELANELYVETHIEINNLETI